MVKVRPKLKKNCSCNKVQPNKKQEHVANSPMTTSTNQKKENVSKTCKFITKEKRDKNLIKKCSYNYKSQQCTYTTQKLEL